MKILLILQSLVKCFVMIEFTSSLRSKKFKLYEVVKISSDSGLNIYILYISVMSLSHL
jgi:hypothetical protein